jgi:hypothetical protein
MPQAPSAPYNKLLEDLRSSVPDRQNYAFQSLLKATDSPVGWAYEVWEDLLRTLVDGDNRQRSIAAQVLSNLAKSDTKERMLKDLAALLKVTKDERFVTARHCLQSLWKVGVAGEPQRKALLSGLEARFKECKAEKNCTLIRYDILVVLRRIFDLVKDEEIRRAAESLMAMEEDPKYRKKYATVWRRNKPSAVAKHSTITSGKCHP